MKHINVVMLEGFVGKPPVWEAQENGRGKCRLRLAVHRGRRSGDDKTEMPPVWTNIHAYDKLAEFIRDHIVQGDRIMVKGELRCASGMGADGAPSFYTYIDAGQVMIGAKRAVEYEAVEK